MFISNAKCIPFLHFVKLLHPLELMVPLSSLDLKENSSVGKSIRILDVKCYVQM